MNTPNIFLVLAFDHPLKAVESVGERMAAGLCTLGLNAVCLSLPRDFDKLVQLPPAQVCGVLSLGPLPLSSRVRSVALWQYFQCPISVYLLDAILYDLARVPVMREFLDAARREARLRLISPEIGYREWLGETLGVHWDHMPFAAFPRVSPATPIISSPLPRIAVVGTIGGELGGSPVGESLHTLLQRVAAPLASLRQIATVHDALLAANAHPMPALTLARELGWTTARALERDALSAAIAVDSWIKRQRRIDAVCSLNGLEVDFYGSGWEELFGNVSGFQYVGQVHHDDIALVLSHYRCALNFDPNWQGGVHDRVYTAAAMGVHVITNENTGLEKAALPSDLITTYDANRPEIAAHIVQNGLLSKCGEQHARADVLERHNWGSRMATWLAPAPDSGGLADAQIIISSEEKTVTMSISS